MGGAEKQQLLGEGVSGTEVPPIWLYESCAAPYPARGLMRQESGKAQILWQNKMCTVECRTCSGNAPWLLKEQAEA